MEKYEVELNFYPVNRNIFGRWYKKKQKSKKIFSQDSNYGKIIFLSDKAKSQIKFLDSEKEYRAVAVFSRRNETSEEVLFFKGIKALGEIVESVDYRVFCERGIMKKISFMADKTVKDEYKNFPDFFPERPYTDLEKKEILLYFSLKKTVAALSLEWSDRYKGFISRWDMTGEKSYKIEIMDGLKIKATPYEKIKAKLYFIDVGKILQKEVFEEKSLLEDSYIELDYEILSEEHFQRDVINQRKEVSFVQGGDWARGPSRFAPTGKRIETEIVEDWKKITARVLIPKDYHLWVEEYLQIKINGNEISFNICIGTNTVTKKVISNHR
ncbi:hypothetical protein KKH36_00835 [Patescibacteria group bacterium]|nr:hypothetical protein [Patescibacteria group bacterium]